MSNLSTQQINQSFQGLLQVPGGITSTLQTVQDGNGNATGLQISSTGASVTTSDTYVVSVDGVQLVGADPRLISDGFGDIVSVKDFGAIGDGIADDTVALQNAITSNRNIFFPAGNYLITSYIDVIGNSIKLFGVGKNSKIISNNLYNMIWLKGVNHVMFENLSFESTYSNSIENVYGLISSSNTVLQNVLFNKCTFSAPLANVNAIKIVAETSNFAENIKVIDCNFENIWRMGVEFQNHVADTVVRYKNVTIENSYFNNIGTIGGYGYSISLSGYGSNCHISNNIFSAVVLGVELVGASNTTIAFNKFVSFNATGTSFSFTGALPMNSNRIIGNIMQAPALSNIRIRNQNDLAMQSNYFDSGAYATYFVGINKSRISNEQYIASGSNVVIIEPTSTDNQFINCRFSNQTSASNFSVFRCYGTGVTDTWLIGCYLYPGTGGTLYDGVAGAIAPKVYISKKNAAAEFLSDPVRNGFNYTTALNLVAGVGINTTSVTIDFGTSGSWQPAIVSLKIKTNTNSGGGDGYTENRIYLRSITSPGCVINNNQVIGTPSNLTVTTLVSGTSVVFTCTHATTTGPSLNFMWDISVDSINFPTIS